MTPAARQELRDYCARARLVREAQSKPEWTAADKADGIVALACIVGLIVVVLL